MKQRRNGIGLFLRHPRTAIRWFIADRRQAAERKQWVSRAFGADSELKDFQRGFKRNLDHCDWVPHSKYSVFTQYDQHVYLRQKEEFLQKYKCFYAVSKTISARRIIELGTHAGASADAYLSGAPNAEYFGLDAFEDGVLRGLVHEVTGEPWQSKETAAKLLTERGFEKWKLIKADLRSLEKLPVQADFVVVDAAHDFENEYADLQLALTADPTYIFVDDADDLTQAQPAITKFLQEDLKDRVAFYCGIDYIGGGLVIKLK